MKILLIAHYTPPHMSVASLRTYKFAKFLRKNGHDVKILTTKKYNFDGLQLNQQNLDEIELISVPYYPFEHFDKFKAKTEVAAINKTAKKSRIDSLKRFVRSLRKVIGSFGDIHDFWIPAAIKKGNELHNSWEFEVMISSFGPPAAHVVASKIKKEHKGIIWVADYRDLWSQNYSTRARFPFSLLERWKEKSVVKTADIITTVSAPLKKKLKSIFLNKKIEVIFNGYEQLHNCSQTNKDLDKVKVIYTGNIYKEQDAAKIFDAIDFLNTKYPKKSYTVDFYGALDSKTLDQINKYDFASFYGRIPRTEILKKQMQADILLLLEWNNPEQQGVLTGKLFEYLETKKPILSIGNHINASGEVVEDIGIGTFASSVEEIIEFIESHNDILADLDKFEHYSFESQIVKLEALIKDVSDEVQ